MTKARGGGRLWKRRWRRWFLVRCLHSHTPTRAHAHTHTQRHTNRCRHAQRERYADFVFVCRFEVDELSIVLQSKSIARNVLENLAMFGFGLAVTAGILAKNHDDRAVPVSHRNVVLGERGVHSRYPRARSRNVRGRGRAACAKNAQRLGLLASSVQKSGVCKIPAGAKLGNLPLSAF